MVGVVVRVSGKGERVVGGVAGRCDFFFQAEDGIRDRNVTGVQTCALPISPSSTCSFSKLGGVTPSASKMSTCLKVFDRWSWPRMTWLILRSASSAQEAM